MNKTALEIRSYSGVAIVFDDFFRDLEHGRARTNTTEELIETLELMGIDFPEEATAAILPATGVLVMRNSRANHHKLADRFIASGLSRADFEVPEEGYPSVDDTSPWDE